MTSKRSAAPLIAGALVIALVAGVSGWFMRSRTDAGPERVATNAELSAEAAEPVRNASSKRVPSAPAPPAFDEDPMAAQAANDAAVTKLVEAGESKLRTRYESERVDAAWAMPKQQALERLSVSPQIEQINAQPLSINARCRTSVCLIDADFPSRLAADDWFTLYTLNAGTEMSHSSSKRTVNPDGSVHLLIYGLARQQ